MNVTLKKLQHVFYFFPSGVPLTYDAIKEKKSYTKVKVDMTRQVII
jgi:hypothetical protein